jgi:hypothetical protein
VSRSARAWAIFILMMTPLNSTELRMDPASLYREEVYTDRKIGTIRVLTPVTSLGSPDGSRAVLYVGETQLLTPGGLLPLSFEIEATTLAEAIEQFGVGANEAVERTRREIEQLRREAASSIIVPDRMPGGFDPSGGAGGLPGGQIRLR